MNFFHPSDLPGYDDTSAIAIAAHAAAKIAADKVYVKVYDETFKAEYQLLAIKKAKEVKDKALAKACTDYKAALNSALELNDPTYLAIQTTAKTMYNQAVFTALQEYDTTRATTM